MPAGMETLHSTLLLLQIHEKKKLILMCFKNKHVLLIRTKQFPLVGFLDSAPFPALLVPDGCCPLVVWLSLQRLAGGSLAASQGPKSAQCGRAVVPQSSQHPMKWDRMLENHEEGR